MVGESELYPMIQWPGPVAQSRVGADRLAHEQFRFPDSLNHLETPGQSGRHSRGVGTSRAMSMGSVDTRCGKPRLAILIEIEIDRIAPQMAALDEDRLRPGVQQRLPSPL